MSSPRKSPASIGLVFEAGADSFRPAGGESRDANGQPRRRYVKDLIRVGDWHKAGDSPVKIDRDRLDHWVDTFNRMKAAGVKVPLPVGHTNDAEKNRGDTIEMYRDGDTLYGVVDLIGEDAIPLASRSEVSIFAAPSVLAGDGTSFSDAIAHIAIVTDPVVNKQSNFVPIAASRGGTVNVPVVRMAQESPTMIDWKTIAAPLGLDIATLTDATAGEAITAKITALTAASKTAAETAAALTAAREQVKTLELARGKPIDIDPSDLEDEADRMGVQIADLATAGNITPAVRDGLSVLLCGKAGARPAISLSRKAAVAAGFTLPLAREVVRILKDNDPVKLGEQTKAQLAKATALSRSTPGAGTGEANPNVVDRMAKLGGIKKS